VTPTWHGSAVIEFPNDLEIVITRDFEAPIDLVFDVLTKPEHVTRWFFDRELEECSIDLRVGGNYRFVCDDVDDHAGVQRPGRPRSHDEVRRFHGQPRPDRRSPAVTARPE